MKFLRLFTLTIFSLTTLFATFFLPLVAQAEDYGLGATASRAGLQTKDTVPQLAGNVIGTALSMISVIFFILMVYGGFLWMTAHGDDAMVKKAQDTITAAVIGIVIILASYAITSYVTKSVESGESPTPPPTVPVAP